jgi:NAD+ synthase (glutamine-hydrolysing)
MKIQLSQIDTTVGDLTGNTAKMLAAVGRAKGRGAELIVFPELAVTGYPPRDLLERKAFIAANLEAVGRLAAAAHGIAIIAGFAMPNETCRGKGLLNAAALCAEGRVVRTIGKCLLPTYDVFDEDRHFEPAAEASVVPFGGERIGVSICEDAWNDPEFWGRTLYDRDPIAEQAAMRATLLVNISASPFALGRPALRERLLAAHAARHRLPLVYVNLVGGNDQLLFDGRSRVFDAAGGRAAGLAAFREDELLWDTTAQVASPATELGTGSAAGSESRGACGPPDVMDTPIAAQPRGCAKSPTAFPVDRTAGSATPPEPGDAEDAFDGLVMGTRDYVAKCGFSKVVIGLSGGIDSSVVAAIAAEALSPAAVTGVAMPSRYSSKGSLDDARALATNLGIALIELPIEKPFAAYLDTLAPIFAGTDPGIAEENIQARIRGNYLMALSNKFGWLVLTTGNKSEMAVGYSTLYGDMSGGLAVLADVPKTLVYAVARHANRRRRLIPEAVFTKPPSAELKPGQTDQDTLPPYEVLDGILRLWVEELRSIREIVAAGYDETVVRDVVRRIDGSEYKRQQAPPGLRITTKAFGLGRRMPIAQRYSEQ